MFTVPHHQDFHQFLCGIYIFIFKVFLGNVVTEPANFQSLIHPSKHEMQLLLLSAPRTWEGKCWPFPGRQEKGVSRVELWNFIWFLQLTWAVKRTWDENVLGDADFLFFLPSEISLHCSLEEEKGSSSLKKMELLDKRHEWECLLAGDQSFETCFATCFTTSPYSCFFLYLESSWLSAPHART